MAWIFVRLKLRVLRRRIAKSSAPALVGLVLLWLGALGGGAIFGGLFASAIGFFHDSVSRVLGLGFNMLGLMWLVAPVIAAALDDTLEPRRFELLPLPTTRLAVGLLVAGLVGPGAVGTLVVLGLGLGWGLADGWTLLPLLLIAVLATVAMSASARWLTTVLSDLLRRRRAQEVVALMMGTVVALPGLLSFAATEGRVSTGDVDRLAGLLDVLIWTPIGAFGGAAAAVADRRVVAAAGWLGYGFGFLWAAVWAFGRALDRLQTRSVSTGSKSVGESTTLMPRRLPLPPAAIGAMAAKELRYLARDMRVRSQLLGGSVLVVVVTLTGGMTVLRTPFAPFLAVVAVFLIVSSLTPNQFGFDGGSFWVYVITVSRLGDVVRGKNLGSALIALPVALVLGSAGAAVSGRWEYLPAALVASVGVLAVWMAVGNIASILGGFRLPDTNLFGNRGMTGASFLFSLLGMVVSGLLTLPLAAAVGIPAWRWGAPEATAGALAGVVYATLVYRIGLGWADRLIDRSALSMVGTIDRDL